MSRIYAHIFGTEKQASVIKTREIFSTSNK